MTAEHLGLGLDDELHQHPLLPAGKVAFNGPEARLVDVELPERSRRRVLGQSTVPISGVENTAVGM